MRFAAPFAVALFSFLAASAAALAQAGKPRPDGSGLAAARAAAPLTSAETLALKPKDSFNECDACPTMVVIPAGTFTMGTAPAEITAVMKELGSAQPKSEGPQRQVTIPRPLAVGKFEVTYTEWAACAAEGGCASNPPESSSWGRRPVTWVSWDDAKQYVAWLSRKTGKAYRLLSEAEWEHAARAGTATRYAFGGTLGKGQAQFSDGSSGSEEDLAEVGSFPANAFGLHDMHGSVAEWVEDTWHPSYDGAPVDGSAWLGGDATVRVIRGGCSLDVPANLRSAARDGSQSDFRFGAYGFRVARTL